MALASKSKKVRLFDRELAQQAAIREPAWFRSPHHLAWIRTLPCACGCGRVAPSEAAHVRYGSDGAAGTKPSDIFTVPLNAFCHRVQHSTSEPAFWTARGRPFPAAWAVEAYALQSQCDRTRQAAKRWLDTGRLTA